MLVVMLAHSTGEVGAVRGNRRAAMGFPNEVLAKAAEVGWLEFQVDCVARTHLSAS